MRYTFFGLLFIFSIVFVTSSFSQEFPAIDKSPMDVIHYPVNYPIQRIQDKNGQSLITRVYYSRPQKNGRKIFGDLIEYGKVWRLGANEATEIEFFTDVKIKGKKIPKGRYTLYCIPYMDKWTIIINKETDTWGAFKYDINKDVLRTEVNVSYSTQNIESFSMLFTQKDDKEFYLKIAWDNVQVQLPISP